MFDFSTLLIDAIPLVVVIFGLVEAVKAFGLTGKTLVAVSLALGLLFGIAYRLTLAFPQGCTGWFSTIIFGLALGLITSGLYDFLDDRLPPPFKI